MSDLKTFNKLITEFYDKMSSWEQSVVNETGYTLAQIHTIEVLGNHGDLRMKDLAQKLGITTGTLTVQIDKLVKSNLIERRNHPEDRRAIIVALTQAGLAIHQHHNQLHMDLVTDLSQVLTAEETDFFNTVLKKINQEF